MQITKKLRSKTSAGCCQKHCFYMYPKRHKIATGIPGPFPEIRLNFPLSSRYGCRIITGRTLKRIPMKPPEEYRKNVYWLKEDEALSLQDELKERGLVARIAKGVVCTPLDERNRISIVPPSVWGETCSRQGSWYRQSDRNHLFLVVSSFDLDSFERARRRSSRGAISSLRGRPRRKKKRSWFRIRSSQNASRRNGTG